MLKYMYNYQVVTTFDNYVTAHALMLRCFPVRNNFQVVDEEHLVFSPLFRMREGMDAYGNRILYGSTREPHDTLAYVSTGIVSQAEYCIPDAAPLPFYKQPSRLTLPTADMLAAFGDLVPEGNVYDYAMKVSHRVNTLMTYAPHATSMGTTAGEAFASRTGVCQDFAHVMIAVCRSRGIYARYVNGFIIGEGETHAWVEVHDGYAWRAIDPTHDTFVCSGYIKLAHGRDAMDCTVDRGTFVGVAQQETKVNVTLVQLSN